MHLIFFLKGIAVGFAIAAPVGPTTVLVIHRTLKQNYKHGLFSGLGAAAADAFYGLVAGFGVGLAIGFLEHHEEIIRVTGGCFLLYWGFRIILSKFAEDHPLIKGEGWGGPFVSTFILTITNPMTILAFMAALAGLGGADIKDSYISLGEWLLGIGSGSFLWWLTLSSLVQAFKEKFNHKAINWMNKITGVIVIGAAVVVLVSLKKYF